MKGSVFKKNMFPSGSSIISSLIVIYITNIHNTTDTCLAPKRSIIRVLEEENNASEILDDEELFGKANDHNFRRAKGKHKYRERESSESTEFDESLPSDSSDYERNPGNPYTVFKDKYVQNWMWNHVMDGDHMNVNPYGPEFNSVGPSGAALFFNRKWWYYNQDDYRPFD